jgi:hypothetical protein
MEHANGAGSVDGACQLRDEQHPPVDRCRRIASHRDIQ